MTSELAEWILSAGFDAEHYFACHGDLAKHGLESADALNHFLRFGFAEGRSIGLKPLPAGLTSFKDLSCSDTAHFRQVCCAVYADQSSNPGSSDYLWSSADELLSTFFPHAGGRPFFVIGDSHTNMYRRLPFSGDTWYAPIVLLCLAGSAAGLANSASRSGYGKKILDWAERHNRATHRDAPIVLKFGQVDIEFVWVFQRVRKGRKRFTLAEFESFALTTVRKYVSFIQKLEGLVGANVLHICSIFPPALNDATWAEGYINAHIGLLEGDRSLEELSIGIRTIEMPDIEMRTIMHAIFNKILRDACVNLNVQFVDDFHPLLGEGGLLNPIYNEQTRGTDHHLDFKPTRGPIERLILQRIFR